MKRISRTFIKPEAIKLLSRLSIIRFVSHLLWPKCRSEIAAALIPPPQSTIDQSLLFGDKAVFQQSFRRRNLGCISRSRNLGSCTILLSDAGLEVIQDRLSRDTVASEDTLPFTVYLVLAGFVDLSEYETTSDVTTKLA